MKNKLVLICASMSILVIGTGIVAPLLTPYANTLNASGIQIGLLFTGFYLVRILLGPYIGRLADKKGPKTILRYSLMLYPIIGTCYILSSTYSILFFTRLLHGVASAMMLPMVMTYIGHISPKGKEGRYMGIYNTTFYGANAVGPLIGGFLSAQYGYRVAFSSLLLLALISLVIVIFFLPPAYKQESINKEKTNTKLYGKFSLVNKTKALLISMRALPRWLQQNTMLLALGVIQVCVSILNIFIISFYILYLTEVGMEISLLGVLLTVYNGIIGGTQLFISGFVDRVDKRTLIIPGGALIAIIVYILTFVQIPWLIVILFTILALVVSITTLSVTSFATIIGRKKHMGETMGFLGAATSLGAIIGPLLLGTLVDTAGITMLFLCISVIWILGIGIFWGLSKKSHNV